MTNQPTDVYPQPHDGSNESMEEAEKVKEILMGLISLQTEMTNSISKLVYFNMRQHNRLLQVEERRMARADTQARRRVNAPTPQPQERCWLVGDCVVVHNNVTGGYRKGVILDLKNLPSVVVQHKRTGRPFTTSIELLELERLV